MTSYVLLRRVPASKFFDESALVHFSFAFAWAPATRPAPQCSSSRECSKFAANSQITLELKTSVNLNSLDLRHFRSFGASFSDNLVTVDGSLPRAHECHALI